MVNRRQKNTRKNLSRIITIVAILLIATAVGLLGWRLWQLNLQKTSEKSVRDLYEPNATPTPTPAPTEARSLSPGEPTPAPTATPEPYVIPKFQKLVENNPDTVGWLRIPNTNVDHVVMQGDDNFYYLDHNFFEDKLTAGSMTLDFRLDAANLEGNVLLYGHHMQVGTMLNDLGKYRRESFYRQNPIIYFDTIYEEAQWEVFSAYVQSNRFNYFKMDFESRDEYFQYIKALQRESIYETDVELSPDDVILTLSTCVYDFEDARMVVHARRVNPIEDSNYD
jgi:sortase B